MKPSIGVQVALMLLIWCPVAFSVRADPPAATSRTTHIQNQFCGRVCAKRFQACRKGAGADDDVVCGTEYVACQTVCIECVPSYDACASSGSTADACVKPFVACIKGGLVTRKAATSPIPFQGGDGTSLKTAVVVGARNEREGITAENLWTAKHHVGWRKADQALIHDGTRSFDRIGYETPDGHRDVWFDVSGFFGKL